MKSMSCYRLVLAAIVVAGFALRLASAQGALWLDEAWSAAMARDAGTPLGVFLGINHDNNHHLNSLWLQMVGFGAPPWVARLPAILAGTAAIGVAAAIGARDGRAAAIAAALLFAVAPPLVTIGSEARGYAVMVLALLVAVLLVDRSIAAKDMQTRATGIALCFLLGTLGQLTMLFGICAIAGWLFMSLWQRKAAPLALVGVLRLLGPGILCAGAVIGVVFGAAAAAGTGMRFGDRDPFAWAAFFEGLANMLANSFGHPQLALAAIPLTMAVLAPGWLSDSSRKNLYLLAILAFPLTLALLHLPNAGHPRYYLLVAVALLLLVADLTGRAFACGGWRRAAATVAVGVMLAGAGVQATALITNQRGDAGVALRTLMTLAPAGTTMAIEQSMSRPTLEAAAVSERYPLALTEAHCPAARFLFVERFRNRRFPAHVTRCGASYRPIAGRRAQGMSGTDWTLYERAP